jgi:hypothetical protein
MLQSSCNRCKLRRQRLQTRRHHTPQRGAKLIFFNVSATRVSFLFCRVFTSIYPERLSDCLCASMPPPSTQRSGRCPKARGRVGIDGGGRGGVRRHVERALSGEKAPPDEKRANGTVGRSVSRYTSPLATGHTATRDPAHSHTYILHAHAHTRGQTESSHGGISENQKSHTVQSDRTFDFFSVCLEPLSECLLRPGPAL